MNKKVFGRWFPLLHIDYAKLGPKWNYPGLVSPYFRLYYINEGRGTIAGADTLLTLEPKYLYLIPSFTLCSLRCDETLGQYFIQFFEESANGISLFQHNRRPMKILAAELDEILFKRLLKINPGRGINRSDNPKIYEKKIYYEEYQELNNQQNGSASLETQGIIQQLLSRFLTPLTYKKQHHVQIPSIVLDAVSYIEVNIAKQLTVMELANRANRHPDYFSRLFLQHMGERPIAFINEKRVERAQYLITASNMSLEEIALEVGFENSPYFTRIFKKVTGLTPGKYSRQTREGNTI